MLKEITDKYSVSNFFFANILTLKKYELAQATGSLGKMVEKWQCQTDERA